MTTCNFLLSHFEVQAGGVKIFLPWFKQDCSSPGLLTTSAMHWVQLIKPSDTKGQANEAISSSPNCNIQTLPLSGTSGDLSLPFSHNLLQTLKSSDSGMSSSRKQHASSAASDRFELLQGPLRRLRRVRQQPARASGGSARVVWEFESG